jgi:hypothetical protein
MDSVLIFCVREFPLYGVFCIYTLIISLIKKQFVVTHRNTILQRTEKAANPQ